LFRLEKDKKDLGSARGGTLSRARRRKDCLDEKGDVWSGSRKGGKRSSSKKKKKGVNEN